VGKSSTRFLVLIFSSPFVAAVTTGLVLPVLSTKPLLMLLVGCCAVGLGVFVLLVGRERVRQGSSEKRIPDAYFWSGALSIASGVGLVLVGLALSRAVGG
jgi:hypothetical protein